MGSDHVTIYPAFLMCKYACSTVLQVQGYVKPDSKCKTVQKLCKISVINVNQFMLSSLVCPG